MCWLALAPVAATAAGASGVKLRYMQTRLSERGWKSLKLLSIEMRPK